MWIIFKKLSVVLSVFTVQLASAQSYSFDYLIMSDQRSTSKNNEFTYDWELSEEKRMSGIHLINSQNPHLKLYLQWGNEGLTAFLRDPERSIIHLFKVFKNPGETGVGFRLEYVDTIRSRKRIYKNRKVTVQKNNDFSYTINVEENGLRKNCITVTVQESNDDLTNAVRLDIPYETERDILIELKKKLDPERNYFITDYLQQYIPGSTFQIKTNAHKVNFTLKLPDTRKIRKLMAPVEAVIINKKH